MGGLYKVSDGLDKLEVAVEPNMVNNIQHLLQKFPDLMVYKSSADTDFICCTSDVNNYVDACDITESNTNAGIFYAWPNTTIDNIKVYSNPPYYIIGRANDKGFGVTPTDRLDDMLTTDNISNIIVRKIRSFLKSKPPINYTD